MPLGDDAFEVGRVIRAHGLEGELIVRTHGDDPGSLLRAERVLLDSDPGVIPYRVRACRPLRLEGAGVRVLLGLVGLETRERAQAWVGAGVRIESALLPPLADDEVYARDLIGLECVSVEGGRLGIVRELWPTAACAQLLVEGPEGELFVPAREPVLVEIAPERGLLVVDLRAIGIEEDDPASDDASGGDLE